MSQTARQQQWQTILQMTEQLHGLSADEDWLAMTELGEARQASLEVYFSAPVDTADAEEIAAGIREIQQSDELLMQNSHVHKQKMSAEVQKISISRQAIKAYSHFEK